MDRTLDRVALIAEDLGRLRRMGVEGHVLDRLAAHLDTLDSMLRPTAADLVRRGMLSSEALRTVDRERSQLFVRLGIDNSG